MSPYYSFSLINTITLIRTRMLARSKTELLSYPLTSMYIYLAEVPDKSATFCPTNREKLHNYQHWNSVEARSVHDLERLSQPSASAAEKWHLQLCRVLCICLSFWCSSTLDFHGSGLGTTWPLAKLTMQKVMFKKSPIPLHYVFHVLGDCFLFMEACRKQIATIVILLQTSWSFGPFQINYSIILNFVHFTSI